MTAPGFRAASGGRLSCSRSCQKKEAWRGRARIPPACRRKFPPHGGAAALLSAGWPRERVFTAAALPDPCWNGCSFLPGAPAASPAIFAWMKGMLSAGMPGGSGKRDAAAFRQERPPPSRRWAVERSFARLKGFRAIRARYRRRPRGRRILVPSARAVILAESLSGPDNEEAGGGLNAKKTKSKLCPPCPFS